MARVPGRDNRIAIPFLVLCLGVVGMLVWLAIPGLPMLVGWAGGTAGGAVAALSTTATPHAVVADTVDIAAADCRELYPDDLWNELTWTADVVLTQSIAPPATALADLTAALAPSNARTCVWRNGDAGTVVTTFATVSADALGLAEAALRGQGFACETAEGALSCTADTAAGGEHQMLKGTLWVTTVDSSWYPEEYDARLARHLWR